MRNIDNCSINWENATRFQEFGNSKIERFNQRGGQITIPANRYFAFIRNGSPEKYDGIMVFSDFPQEINTASSERGKIISYMHPYDKKRTIIKMFEQ